MSGNGTPTFLIEDAKLGVKFSDAARLQGHFGLYSYSNLFSSVANQSSFLGNSVIGYGSTGSSFLYGFQGYEGGGEFSWEIAPDVKLLTGAAWIFNNQAPDGMNQGELGYAELGFPVNDNLSITPKGTLFQSESDSAPAYFTRNDLGNTNRKGFGAEIDLKMPKNSLEVDARWVRSYVLNSTIPSFQSTLNYISLTLMKTYNLN